MRQQFTGMATSRIQGRLRVLDLDGLTVSLKPFQIRSISNTNHKHFKRNRMDASHITITNSSQGGWTSVSQFFVNTPLDILEQIVDLAEMGHSFDLTPYTGKEPIRLDNINDLLPKPSHKTPITISSAPKGMK